jgi:predicted DsbA family dithiol-disulfide isomerase
MTAMIELYADIICPFAHVSMRRLAERRAALGRDDVRIVVRSWPLEVVNGEPFDPHKIDEEIQVLRDSVAPDLFEEFDPGSYPASTIPALAVTAAGYASDLLSGERIAFELRDLLFERGVDISDPDVLGDLADRHGLARSSMDDHRVVTEEFEEGRRRGVVGSPHYFLGDHDVFCPTLDISKPAGEMQVRFDPERFEAFAADAFSGV